MNKYVVFPLLIAIVVVFILVKLQEQNKQQATSADTQLKQQGSLMQGKDTTANEPQENLTYYQGAILAGKGSAPLLDFANSDYDRALASDKIILLYFYANWCPICRVELPNELYPAFNELTTDKVVGFRVSYNDNETDDSEKALSKRFGITYQHTKVILKDGKEVSRSLDSWKKEQYLDEINKQL